MHHYSLPIEHAFRLYINSQTEVVLICTDEALQELIVGYLYNEGLIGGLSDILEIQITPNHDSAHILLTSGIDISNQRVIPSGMGGAQISLPEISIRAPIRNRYSPDYILSCSRIMDNHAVKYALSGGMHCSALFGLPGKLSLFEDIGRHNTLDKLAGDCLLRDISSSDTLLITTGRISEDMVQKASRIGASVIASYSVPTQRAFHLAVQTNISLIGYLNKNKVTVYTVPERICECGSNQFCSYN